MATVLVFLFHFAMWWLVISVLVVIGIPLALWRLGSHVESDKDETRPGDME